MKLLEMFRQEHIATGFASWRKVLLVSILRASLCVVTCAMTGTIFAQPAKTAEGRIIFQTGNAWSPRTNINADTVMVYGTDDTVAERIKSWRDHGYHITVMTGVAWGRYAPYLRGDFDGKQHWAETQQEKSGKLRLHSGREVPYIAPSLSYGRYLAQRVRIALDAGAEAITSKSLNSGPMQVGVTASSASGKTSITKPGKHLTAPRTRNTVPQS